MSGVVFLVLTMFLAMFSGVLVQYGLSTPSIANAIQGPIDCDINGIGTFCAFPAFSPPKLLNSTRTIANDPGFPNCISIGFATLNPLACFQSTIGAVASTAQAVANGFGLVFYAGSYIGILALVFFIKVGTGIVLIYQITLIMSQTFGIPFLNYFYVGILVFYIMYGLSMLKPGGSGLPG